MLHSPRKPRAPAPARRWTAAAWWRLPLCSFAAFVRRTVTRGRTHRRRMRVRGRGARAARGHPPTPRRTKRAGRIAPAARAAAPRGRPTLGDPDEPPPGHGRDRLVEPRRGRVAVLGPGRLARRHPLGRHRGLVLLAGQPLARVGRLALVADDLAPGGVVAVDLLEELVDELVGGDL